MAEACARRTVKTSSGMAMETNRKIKKTLTPTEAILESISDGVFTVDREWNVTSFNRAAEEITGIPRNEAIGRLCSEVFRSNMCETECALRKTFRSGRPVIGKTGYIIDADGGRIPISLSTAVIRDPNGRVTGGVETFRDLSEVEALRQELEGRYRVGDIVSRSPLMQKVFEVLPAVASSSSTVLIIGETGTGKELIARTIHSLSPRRQNPFVAVNCGALPDTLLESELFGYKAGAFTGAGRDKPGRFAIAKGGTLLLDEIGEVSQALQVSLLRVLQDKRYEPLGATRTETADVRIIAATNRDLAKLASSGAFREDLYYRINVVRIELPPLRDRKEDIGLLADQFISRFNSLQQKTISGIDTEAMSLLMAYDWPGNIRELENVIERAFVLCQSGLIGIRHLPPELTKRDVERPVAEGDMRSVMQTAEAGTLRRVLEKNSFNRTAAAKELGIDKSTLFRKMRRLGIMLPSRNRNS